MGIRKSWPIRPAKAKLLVGLRLVRAGEPQVTDIEKPCVVVPEREWLCVRKNGDDLGRWLAKTAPRGVPLMSPRRAGTRRGDPLAGADS